jgi:hypothetical protein
LETPVRSPFSKALSAATRNDNGLADVPGGDALNEHGYPIDPVGRADRMRTKAKLGAARAKLRKMASAGIQNFGGLVKRSNRSKLEGALGKRSANTLVASANQAMQLGIIEPSSVIGPSFIIDPSIIVVRRRRPRR